MVNGVYKPIYNQGGTTLWGRQWQAGEIVADFWMFPVGNPP